MVSCLASYAASLGLTPCLQVVQGLTELGLEVHSARISSDGGWFVDGMLPVSSLILIFYVGRSKSLIPFLMC